MARSSLVLRLVVLAALSAAAWVALGAASGGAFANAAPATAAVRGARTAMRGMEEDIDARIAGSKVFMVSKEACPFCLRAKRIFKKLGVEVDVMDLEDTSRKPLVEDVAAVQDYMGKVTGARSVPRVFIGGDFVGGGDDVVAKEQSGELQELLTKVGAMA